MRYKILLYGLVAAAVTSCSSAYKATQTPDDVYYSPARPGVEKQTAKNDKYEEYLGSEDDQYLRMKIRNRQRWAGLDDYAYWNDSRYIPYYNYNYDYYRNNLYNAYAWNNWNMPYSSFYYNPYYSMGIGSGLMLGYYPQYGYGYGYGYGYNPYGSTYIIKNPTRRSPSVNRPNLNAYRNGLYNNNNSNNRNNQGFGNTLKRVFTPSENQGNYNYNNRNSNTNTYSSPQRTYTPSSSSSSSGSSSGGSGNSGGVSRPPR